MNQYMRAFVEGTPADEGPIRFVAGTEGLKIDGRSFLMSGADLTRYEANPVVLWAHDGNKPPIGRGVAAVEDGRLVIDIEFDQDDEFARAVESKYRRGFMNAVSMLPLPAGHRRGMRPRSGEISEWELVEVSAVPIPVDPEAVKVSRSLLKHAGQELIDMAEHSRSLTVNDQRERLSAAANERFGGEGTWVWVRDFNPEEMWVVVEVETDGECTCYQLTYSIDADDNLTLTDGDPVEVEVRTSYEPVTAPEPPSQGEDESMRSLIAALEIEGFQRSAPASPPNDLAALSALAAALPTPEEG